VNRRLKARLGWGAIAVAAVLVLGTAPAAAADGDGDGVPNGNDRCPTLRGPRPSGCPVGKWRLRNTNSAGPADIRFSFGISAWTPVAGDWDGDGDDFVGGYDPQNGRWHLVELAEESATEADVVRLVDCLISSIVAPGPRIPITGDWDGDGDDTVGVYTPRTGQFHLRNSNTTGPPDLVFAFGGVQPSRQIRAVAGDFDGDGVHTVGLYRRDTRTWRLTNTNAPGAPDLNFSWGVSNPAGLSVVVGDWDANGTETVGLGYTADNNEVIEAVFRLRNTNTPGQADLSFSWGGLNAGSYEIGGSVVGDWNGDGRDSTGFRIP